MPGGRRLWLCLVMGYLGLLAIGACGGGAVPTVAPSPSPTLTAEAGVEAYRKLVDLVMDTIGSGTRLLSGVGVQFV